MTQEELANVVSAWKVRDPTARHGISSYGGMSLVEFAESLGFTGRELMDAFRIRFDELNEHLKTLPK
jgi:hypothetical protein